MAREAEEASKREAAMAKYAQEAERIARDNAAKRKAEVEAHKATEAAAKRAAAEQARRPTLPLEERTRARKRQEEEQLKRKGSVAKLHVSAETSRKLGEHKKSSEDLFGTKAPEWGEGIDVYCFGTSLSYMYISTSGLCGMQQVRTVEWCQLYARTVQRCVYGLMCILLPDSRACMCLCVTCAMCLHLYITYMMSLSMCLCVGPSQAKAKSGRR